MRHPYGFGLLRITEGADLSLITGGTWEPPLEEIDAWVRAQPLPTDGAYYGGSARR